MELYDKNIIINRVRTKLLLKIDKELSINIKNNNTLINSLSLEELSKKFKAYDYILELKLSFRSSTLNKKDKKPKVAFKEEHKKKETHHSLYDSPKENCTAYSSNISNNTITSNYRSRSSIGKKAKSTHNIAYNSNYYKTGITSKTNYGNKLI